MKITALVENKSSCDLSPKHGLSLYIETPNHKVLFDLGPDNTLFENSQKKNIDLTTIDTVIVSHGHMDHGGALEKFLEINQTAKIYIQQNAFEPHYAKVLLVKTDIGLNPALANHPQIIQVNGDYQIDAELALFTVDNTSKYYSDANKTLYTNDKPDDFSHEHNLLISGKSNVIIVGCGHTGIVNIMEKAIKYQPKICVGGYHLYNPITKKTVPNTTLDGIAKSLAKYDMTFYTCHCTGDKAYTYLAKRLNNLSYLACGETIEIE